MYKCSFCGFKSDDLEDFEEDMAHHAGFWCPYCDGFTFFGTEDRSFLLYLEDKNKEEMHKKVPFKVRTSPLRYPGGKSQMIGVLLDACRKSHMDNFAESFAGGASVGLSLLLAGQIKDLYLNDMDFGVYSLFKMIKENPGWLKEKINEFIPTEEEYFKCRKHVLDNYFGCSTAEAAWYLLVTNRLAFSGIAFANCMSNPAARWNAKTLCKRIDDIHVYANHLHVFHMDALKFIEKMYWMNNTTIFVDPPYFEKGKDLYPCSYTENDHIKLSFLLEELHKGCPGADIIVTYDHQKEISEMYCYPEQRVIGRKYSIAN